MLSHTAALLSAALLTWLMIMVAAALKTRLWSPSGFQKAAGNRETTTEPSPLAGRADRAAKNMLENVILFAIVMLAVHVAGKVGEQSALGATLFVAARVVYWLVYLAGIPYLRTAVWGVAVAGMIIVGLAAL